MLQMDYKNYLKKVVTVKSAYSNFVDFALNPEGSYNSVSNDWISKKDTFNIAKNELDIIIPDKINIIINEEPITYDFRFVNFGMTQYEVIDSELANCDESDYQLNDILPSSNFLDYTDVNCYGLKAEITYQFDSARALDCIEIGFNEEASINSIYDIFSSLYGGDFSEPHYVEGHNDAPYIQVLIKDKAAMLTAVTEEEYKEVQYYDQRLSNSEDDSEAEDDDEMEKDTETEKKVETEKDEKPEIILDTSSELTGKHHANINIEDYGTISVELDADSAPITVTNFVKLVQDGFYDGLTFHRIIDGFMMQGGDPLGDGTGGATETIKGEFSDNGIDNNISHTRGTISMARSANPDSASSQFFIVQTDSTFLDGSYAAFGHVTDGMDIVDKICNKAGTEDRTLPSDEQPVIKDITIID